MDQKFNMVKAQKLMLPNHHKTMFQLKNLLLLTCFKLYHIYKDSH